MRISDWSSDVCSSDLDQLAVGSSVSFAASAAGGTVKNFKKWRDADPDFSSDWEEALEEGTDFLADAAKIGRAHVCTPVTKAQLVCRLMLEKKTKRHTSRLE